MLLMGLAGAGKSYVIGNLVNLLGDSVKVMAHYGKAAIAINGETIMGAFGMGIGSKHK